MHDQANNEEKAQKAWQEFLEHYAPEGFMGISRTTDEEHRLSLVTPHTLTPSEQGRECLGNGEWPGYECQCDECEYFLTCFPQYL